MQIGVWEALKTIIIAEENMDKPVTLMPISSLDLVACIPKELKGVVAEMSMHWLWSSEILEIL